jgi:hypothetical protein
MRSSTLIGLCAIVVIAVVAFANRSDAPTGDQVDAAAPANASAAPVGVVRTTTSTTCAADGCPTACASDETFVSALCVGATTASFSSNLQVENGVLKATCGPSSASIVVACARK